MVELSQIFSSGSFPQTLQLISRIPSIEVGKSLLNKSSFGWPSNWSVILLQLHSSVCESRLSRLGPELDEEKRECAYACEKPLSTLLLFHLKCCRGDWPSERMTASETGVENKRGREETAVISRLKYPGWFPKEILTGFRFFWGLDRIERGVRTTFLALIISPQKFPVYSETWNRQKEHVRYVHDLYAIYSIWGFFLETLIDACMLYKAVKHNMRIAA